MSNMTKMFYNVNFNYNGNLTTEPRFAWGLSEFELDPSVSIKEQILQHLEDMGYDPERVSNLNLISFNPVSY